MADLAQFASRLSQRCPTLDVAGSAKELTVRRGGKTVRLRAGEEVSTFDARERSRRRREGLSYLDLGTGSLYVDEPGLFLYVRLPRSAASRLSAYQCALLSAILDGGRREWFELGIAGSQVDLIRLVKLELGIEVSPMAMSRFLEALRTKGIVRGDGRARLVRQRAFRSLREDVRLSAVGRAETYAGDYRVVEERLDEQLGSRFARGVADVLLRETGAWIEPRDYLVDGSALPGIRSSLGSPVPGGYKGEVVIVRPALRVPLGLLTLGRRSLQPLLGLAEAARSDSPVARQAGLEAWKKREQAWK
jgi:hypothetical protein